MWSSFWFISFLIIFIQMLLVLLSLSQKIFFKILLFHFHNVMVELYFATIKLHFLWIRTFFTISHYIMLPLLLSLPEKKLWKNLIIFHILIHSFLRFRCLNLPSFFNLPHFPWFLGQKAFSSVLCCNDNFWNWSTVFVL